MKAVILAGGFGTRISEETHLKPKPMVLIGGKPILWHVIKIYNFYGIKEFIICCGYKGYLIKEYFANYFFHTSDLKIDLKSNKIDILKKNQEDWQITLIDTGEKTMTGGRLKRVREYLDDEPFFFTYGDGLSNLNIHELKKAHIDSGKIATVTAVHPPVRFGELQLSRNFVKRFSEKRQIKNSWISGGFFIFNKKIFNYLKNDETILETTPMNKLTSKKNLAAFKHEGFWQCMDTLREKKILEEMLKDNKAPWKMINQ